MSAKIFLFVNNNKELHFLVLFEVDVHSSNAKMRNELLPFLDGCADGRFIWFPNLKLYGITLVVKKFHKNAGLSLFTVVYISVAKSLQSVSRTFSIV